MHLALFLGETPQALHIPKGDHGLRRQGHMVFIVSGLGVLGRSSQKQEAVFLGVSALSE